MKIPITFTVAASKAIVGKDGKRYVLLEGIAAGIGIAKIFAKEELIPDDLEGKRINCEFEIGLDQKFNLSLRLKRVIGLA